MNFKNISNQDLHLRLEKLARTERKITHLILLHINEVESRKLFFELGFESFYSYLTKGLKYSESAAYRRIQAARLMRTSSTEVATAIAEKLESGALHLSQLTQVQKCLKEEKKKGTVVGQQKVTEIIQSIESKSTFESEKILAKEFNFRIKTSDSVKPQKDESIRLEITLSKEQFAKLNQAKNLLSHQCPEGSWSEVISTLAEKIIRAKIRRGYSQSQVEAEQIVITGESKSSHRKDAPRNTSSDTSSKTQMYRSVVPSRLRRHVFEKAQHQCEFANTHTGQKCGSKFQLEIDHRKPLALGGDNTSENLRVLCRAHNQWAWQLSSLGQAPIDG